MYQSNKLKQAGFTLIELIVVISILGILAAIAIPRFMSVQTEARAAVINGATGALNSAVAIARAQYKLANNPSANTVTIDGQLVGVNTGTGIPLGTAAGIGAALQSTSGYDIDYTDPDAVTFKSSGYTSATCQASYSGTTGAVVTTISGC